jgi:hypothetical protein
MLHFRWNILGGQVFVSEIFSPAEPNSQVSSQWKLFQDPFPNRIAGSDELTKLMASLKRVLVRRKDIQSCPFHLLLHRWARYSELYPVVDFTIISKRACSLKFAFYIPRTFKFVFGRLSPTIRFHVAFDANFRNAKYLSLTASVHTNGNNEVYLRIENDDETSFTELPFDVMCENDIPVEDFVRTYRSRFVLDAKNFFIHWEPRFDQAILACFSAKQYSRPALCLDFNPMRLLANHVHYPLNVVPLRCFFLMILNFYHARRFDEVAKDPSLQTFLPSIAMKMKISCLRHLVARSNGVESD